MGRLAALTTAHETAFRAEAGVDLPSLISRLLEPYVHGVWGEVVTIEGGPEVDIPQRKVQSLAFVLHELATNAVKHCALSVPEGRLCIAWTIATSNAGSCLQLSWRELGGPAVVTPATPGFGMKLIKAAARELGGEPELNFVPQGLQANITVQLAPE